jgi:hypothetical protein
MTFEILAIIVFLNVAATITLWRTAVRRPEKLKKKFLNRLWRGKPITPKHEPPRPLEDVWTVRKAAWLQFLSDFGDFANVVNWWLADLHQGPGVCRNCRSPSFRSLPKTRPPTADAMLYSTIKPAWAKSKSSRIRDTAPKTLVCGSTSNSTRSAS